MIIHCRGHLKGDSTQIIGHRLADQAAKRAALLELPGQFSLYPGGETPAPHRLSFLLSLRERASSEELSKTADGWWIISDQKILLPAHCQWATFKFLHDSTHLGRDAMLCLTCCLFTGVRFPTVIKKVTKACTLCTVNNSSEGLRPLPLLKPVQPRGIYPAEDRQLDFPQMPRCQGYQTYLFS